MPATGRSQLVGQPGHGIEQIEQIAHIPANSFNVAIASFIGQNIGAKKLERVKNGYRATVRMGIRVRAATIGFPSRHATSPGRHDAEPGLVESRARPERVSCRASP